MDAFVDATVKIGSLVVALVTAYLAYRGRIAGLNMRRYKDLGSQNDQLREDLANMVSWAYSVKIEAAQHGWTLAPPPALKSARDDVVDVGADTG